jgi:DNA polymerase-1
MADYIITKNREYFEKVGDYNYCSLEEILLPEIISIDSETTGLDSRHHDMFCLQVGSGVNNYIIDFYTSDDHYTFQDVIPYLDGKILVGQNITFDLGFFYKHDFWPKEVRDTMIASRILYNGDPTKRHDLGSLMEREMGIKLDKYEQKNIHLVKLSQSSTITYSFNDVDRLLDLHSVLYSKLDERGSLDTYRLHYRYVRALAYMEQCGLPISSEKWAAKMEEDVVNSFKWKQTIEAYIFDHLPRYANNQLNLFEDGLKKITVSVNSPHQMLKVFNDFGIPTKDKDDKDSINENVISKSKHEFVEMWINYQVANHRVTTFGDKIYQQIENERLYTNFNPMVDTARLSSRRGSINFLNFPADKTTRYCFKANQGNVMVVCDYEAQEGIILTDRSKDEAMKKSVLEGQDLHCLLTKAVFPELADLSDNEIKEKHKPKRDICKVVRFLFSYGGNAFTLHMNEGFPLKEAITIEDAFKNLHKGVYEWGERIYQESVKKGYIESAGGWKLKLPRYDEFLETKTKVEAITREEWTKYKIGKIDFKKKFEEYEQGREYTYQFPESVNFYNSKKKDIQSFFKLKSEYQRLALNNPIQSVGSHMIKLSTCILFDWIIENNYQWKVLICNSVHDELVIECPKELAEETRLQVEVSMKEGGNFYLDEFKLNAQANIGESWGQAK